MTSIEVNFRPISNPLEPTGVPSWQSCFPGRKFATSIIFLSLIPPAHAGVGGDDFANNLFSDLAPILALFGEQVAKQFLSESMGWADNILFAVAPLGVITGIVSAIRVGGPAWMKAVIGRAREGRAQVELELMSSNSPDVGEMWNGQAIVRVAGTPEVFEVVYTPPDDPAGGLRKGDSSAYDPSIHIDTLGDRNIFFERPSSDQRISEDRQEIAFDDDIELLPLLPDSEDHHQQAGPPNISLNARGKLVTGREKWCWALFGIAVQLIVLIYGGSISYHPSWKFHFLKNDLAPSTQSFVFTAVGTVSLCFGMLICSYVVETATTEEEWVLKDPDREVQVAWVQKGGTVNDQVFEPYVILGHQDQRVIKTSQRCDRKTGIQLAYWVLLATFISIIGFVIQFIGLRGMHWSATIVQLGATGLMTIVRSFVRRRMSREPTATKAVEGRELDCMARRIGRCAAWKVVSEPGEQSPPVDDRTPVDDRGLANRVLQIRKHLEDLSHWPTDVQTTADSLCTAMERTMNYIYASKDIVLGQDFLEQPELSWHLTVRTTPEVKASPPEVTWVHRLFSRNSTNSETPGLSNDPACYGGLTFKIRRLRHLGVWEPWRIDEDTRCEIKAALSLWMLRLREEEVHFGAAGASYGEENLRAGVAKNVKVFGVWHEVDARLWIGSQGVDIRVGYPGDISKEENIPIYRFIGKLKHLEHLGPPFVAVIQSTSMQSLFAQQMFSNFFSAIVPFIDTISGSTDFFEDTQTGSLIRGLQNSEVTRLTEIVCETGLGTRQEVLMSELSEFLSF